MVRMNRKAIAEETVRIAESGSYEFDGKTVSIASATQSCLEHTRFYAPEAVSELVEKAKAISASGSPAEVEVVNETTLEGCARLVSSGVKDFSALNFASAKNPGGGFLGGGQAQEESLARSSALYRSLLQAREFYELGKRSSLLYTDAMIVSPHCPVFRDDSGALLPRPFNVTFLTCAAPNAGAIDKNTPNLKMRIPAAFRRRIAGVFAASLLHVCRTIVLGAWGCGVFRNDPTMVAKEFAHAVPTDWLYRFERIVFSVYDTSPTNHIFNEFAKITSKG